MYHCKVMIVDDLWVSVGSTNFDNRSFSLNDEANLNIMDAEFALEQSRTFEADRARAREITYSMWKARPRSEMVIEWLAGLFRSQL
jgi:cardiolipin synthase